MLKQQTLTGSCSLNGTGLQPVIRTLKESGYTNIKVVKEQEQPDGNFPTCPYPNPENKELLVIPGATHTDLYDGGGKDAIPFDKLETFFRTYLK